ncbi:MAG: metalloregulator ArsR/SmtB family transcription factor [Gemmatimonadetes bacterium]|nr:metalloregulator ArsR/SmtB family transcription factor [Gemmatimonadota bacterium]
MFVCEMMNMTTAPPILERLSALGDETRARILALLERSELTVTELASVLQAPQPGVSRHLKTLAAEGWVEARAQGRNRHYRLAPDLDEPARALWRIVRKEIGGSGIYAADAERARGVLERRRLRSAEFFAQAAERWDEVREQLFGPSANLLPMLGLLQEDWVVADLGVGTGALAETLAPFAARVIGVDRSEQMLAAARHRLGQTANVEIRRGDLERLPVADEELDVAVLALVLHYVVDPPAVLAEVRRALKPRGRLVLMDMRTHDRGPWYAEEMGHVWPGFEADQVRGWLVEAGFAHARVVPLPPSRDATGPLLFLASAVKP